MSVLVPNVVGLSLAAATSTLTASGFSVSGTTETSNLAPIGNVVSQLPAAGTSEASPVPVALTLSQGQDIALCFAAIGMTAANASALITSLGWVPYLTYEYTNPDPPPEYPFWYQPAGYCQGYAASQEYEPGGATIQLSISLGLPDPVPNVIGMTLSAAQSALASAYAILGTVTYGVSSYPLGQIYQQAPVGGTPQPSPLTVSVSISAVAIPDLTGMTQEEASTTLEAVGLVVGIVGWDYSTTTPSTVFLQSPLAGSAAPIGSVVSFTLSLGARPLFVPNVIGLTAATAATAIQNAGFQVGLVLNAPSPIVAAGTVMVQNPSPGTAEVSGFSVSYTVSNGPVAEVAGIDALSTVITQYQNCPRIVQLATNFAVALNTSRDLQQWYNIVWDVTSAKWWGLDILGRLVGVNRLLELPSSNLYFGPGDGAVPQDRLGLSQGPFQPPNTPIGNSYLLGDDAFRIVILCKAMANIAGNTLPALNTILAFLFKDRGPAYLIDNFDMTMTLILGFEPTVVEAAVLAETGVFPRPSGVLVPTQVNVRTGLFGFDIPAGTYEPFEFGTFDTPIGA